MATNKLAAALYFIIPVIVVIIFETIITQYGLAKFWAINRVSWMPPGWVFGLAWALIFALITWGGYTYYVQETNSTKQINFLNAFYIQLLLNLAWVIIFFGNPSIWAGRFALMILLFLFLSVLYLIWVTWSVNQMASWFFIIYAGWLVFAAALNIAFIM